MVRSLIAILVAFCISIVGFTKPAYANINDFADFSHNHGITLNQGNNGSTNFNYFNNPTNEGNIQNPANNFIDSLVDGAVVTAGMAIGGAIVCYALDGIATAFFPPAAAAAFCPAIGAAGGVKAMAHTQH